MNTQDIAAQTSTQDINEVLAAAATSTTAATRLLTNEQVTRILRSRKLVDETMVGAHITEGLRVVGRGNPTKDGSRVVYNTNAMRKNAMAEAVAHLRAGLSLDTMGDTPAAQEAYRKCLNAGVLTFSLPADWTQFPANALITASLQSFIIKEGPDKGKEGLGLSNTALVPGVKLSAAADVWDILLGADAPAQELTNAAVVA